MNPIKYALEEIHFRIPEDILNVVFLGLDKQLYDDADSLDYRITKSVLRGIVLRKLNVISMCEVMIPLQHSYVSERNNRVIITIPKSVTGNKSIIMPLELSSGSGYLNNSNYYSSNPLSQLANQMFISSAPSNLTTISNLTLIGDNTILVNDYRLQPGLITVGGYIRCILEFDNNFTQMLTRSLDIFGRFCVEACKFYIYNRAYIQLGRSYIESGYDLGPMKDIIDSYSQSEQVMDEMMNNIMPMTLFASDPERMSLLIRDMISYR